MEHLLKGLLRRRLVLGIVGVVWLGVSCGGLVILAMYADSPGPIPQAPSRWPSDTQISLGQRRDTLILFAHPHCPCTRASLGELEKIVARYQGSLTPWVVFFKPASSDDGWEQTDLWNTAAAIPGAHVVADTDGVEARRFNATTSGQTLLYNDQGKLLFEGGITLARGHAGDNAGRSAIEDCLTNTAPSRRRDASFRLSNCCFDREELRNRSDGDLFG